MDKARTYSVRNLDRFQHYKDRNPPWVKLHQSFLMDHDVSTLSDGAKFFALASILLASRSNNIIPMDATWLWGQTGAKSAGAVLGYLQELEKIGFIECLQDASKMLAPSASPSRVEKRERREHTNPESPTRAVVDRVFSFWVWITEKPNSKLTPKRKAKVIDRLKQGYTEETILRGIVGCSQDPFHQGDNPNGREFMDLELICRSGEKLEFFVDMCKEEHYGKAIAGWRRDTGQGGNGPNLESPPKPEPGESDQDSPDETQPDPFLPSA